MLLMMLLALLPDWNSIDSVRKAHSDLELAGIVFFALLAVAESLAHGSKSNDRKHLYDSIGIWFFCIAVACEAVGYWYGQRNDALSERVIVSLDAKARDAASNASTALTDSGAALSQSKDALTKAGRAEASLGKAADKANKAQTAAANALTLARDTRQEADSFEKDIKLAQKTAAEAKEKMAARHLSPEQKEAIKDFLLVAPPASVEIEIFVGTEDGVTFATELSDAIASGGWKAPIIWQTTQYGELRDTSLIIKDAAHLPPGIKRLQDALKQAGIEAIAHPDVNLPRNELFLLVSPKSR